jgi:ribosomal protein L3 glutamine methyltransferase
MSDFNIAELSRQLHTIGDYLRFATSQFNQADLFFGHGTDNAWDEAVNLVMYALHLPPDLDKSVNACHLIEQEKIAVLNLIQRRIEQQCPAAYLINQAYFAGLPFYVDERVLVPRSPIAELIERKFDGLLPTHANPTRILDLCTGSGCIAIACAYAFPAAEVDAVDLSIDALDVTQINIENHGLLEQVIPIQSDVFTGVANEKYDLIVTNPPYVDQQDVDNLPYEYSHEPAMGLGSGEDGLDVVRVILAQANKHLTEQGLLICEVGNSQIHLERVYPEVPFYWISFERGGHGVFSLTKAQLEQYADIFQARIKR